MTANPRSDEIAVWTLDRALPVVLALYLEKLGWGPASCAENAPMPRLGTSRSENLGPDPGFPVGAISRRGKLLEMALGTGPAIR